jgi:hypothetical protein
MLRHLSKEIAECREHAAYCARKAQGARADEMREDFLRLEKNWLQLARSYEFAQALLEDDHNVVSIRRRG